MLIQVSTFWSLNHGRRAHRRAKSSAAVHSKVHSTSQGTELSRIYLFCSVYFFTFSEFGSAASAGRPQHSTDSCPGLCSSPLQGLIQGKDQREEGRASIQARSIPLRYMKLLRCISCTDCLYFDMLLLWRQFCVVTWKKHMELNAFLSNFEKGQFLATFVISILAPNTLSFPCSFLSYGTWLRVSSSQGTKCLTSLLLTIY